jgi:hypothetical protein
MITRGRFLLCAGKKNAKHTSLQNSRAKKWRKKNLYVVND